MYVYFQVRLTFETMPTDIIRVMGIDFVSSHPDSYLAHRADVVWRIQSDRIEWVKDQWKEEHTSTAAKYGYAFIQQVTEGMSSFARALCARLGLPLETLDEPSGTTRVTYSEDTHGEG